MQAVGYRTSLPITDPESLIDLDLPISEPGPRDLRVAVYAVSVNPVDVKLRARAAPPAGEARVLAFDTAAALPLTSIIAWKLLFDRLGVERGEGSRGTLLIINGAGSVGSILTQFARKLTDLTIIATASRPETSDWCRSMGARHVTTIAARSTRACTTSGCATPSMSPG